MSAAVIIADDHPMYRRGLADILAGIPGVGPVYEAANGRQVLDLVRQHNPAAILLDLGMPILNGQQTLHELRQVSPQVKVLVISMRTDTETIRQALEAGASGYLPKEADASEIEAALQAVLADQLYLPAQLTRQLVLRPATAFSSLTDRERQVLVRLGQQQTTAQIADALCMSTRTVERLRSSILEKTGCTSTSGAVLYAERHGLLPQVFG